MKSKGFTKRYAPLRAKTGFKRTQVSFKTKKPLKRSRITIRKEPTPQQILDSIVSEVVRRSAANSSGYAQCITCELWFPWGDMDCGHFQKRGNLATRYHPWNIHAQCRDCNRFKDGKEKEHARYIDMTYGEGTAAMLKKKSKEVVLNFPYEKEIVTWTLRLDRLKINEVDQNG